VSRRKGKHWELWFINNGLKEIFENIERNPYIQEKQGGVDLENTSCFNFECKGGKSYKIVKVRRMLNQVEQEGKKENFNCVLVKPAHEKAFVILSFSDFLEILTLMKTERII
jgi:hypothetical protein